MAKLTGTHGVADLYAAQFANLTAAEADVDGLARVLAEDNANFSRSLTEALADLAETSPLRDATQSGSIGGDMMEFDEYGQGPTQKDVAGALIYFPLRRFGYPVGWTVQWEKNATVADYAKKQAAAQGADYRRTRYEFQKAIYTPTNYTFVDDLVDHATLAVKAFINADSSAMQNGPNGETFDSSTHTHYDGAASLSATNLQALINDVTEHRAGAQVRVYINQADAATVAALSGFVALTVPVLTIGDANGIIAAPRLDITRLDDRLVGYFNGAEVWTKPWAVANYVVAADVAAPVKPLRRRVERNDRGMHIAAQVDVHPLRAQYIEHFYGFAALNRLAVAVLKFNNATYSAPTLTY